MSFAMRLGLRYVKGLREEAAQALVVQRRMRAFTSVDDLARRVPELRKNELVALAEIGALNSIEQPVPSRRLTAPASFHFPLATDSHQRSSASFSGEMSDVSNLPTASELGFKSELRTQNSEIEVSVPPSLRGEGSLHRRSALWQVERAAHYPGPLLDCDDASPDHDPNSPLAPMTPDERLVADFHNTGLTVGPHPMAYRRAQMNQLRVRRAADLAKLRNGNRVRTAGCVIARQRPGTASGFVFLSLEDETGIANVIITPQLFEQHRMIVAGEQFLLIEGVLQHQEGVVSIRAEKVVALHSLELETSSHDFH